jgi:hypothetical protein
MSPEGVSRNRAIRRPRWTAILTVGLTLAATVTIADEVSFTETDSSLRLDNGLVAIEFDRKDGAWTSLTHRSIDGSLITREKIGPGVDFRIDETWMVETLGSVLLRHAVERDAASSAATLALTYGVGKRAPVVYIPERWKDRAPDPAPVYSPPPPYEFELTVRSTILPGSPRIDRRATLVRNLGKNFFRSSFRRLDGFLFVVPNVVVGRPQDCTVNVPGPLYTYTFVEAGTPYEKLAGTYIDSKTTPDRLPGIVGIENRPAGLTLASWIDTRAEVAREHPEFFTRNEQGLIETHFAWGSLNTDPGNPAYVKFMEELVLHDLQTYDIDGYRVDANSFKSPNWDPACPRRPWQASSTLPLYRAMYAALQREKKDVVFYSEMFGPAWHSVSNLAQDANWAVVTDLFAQFDEGKANAATYKAGMLQLQESLQPGANRIRFCRNHDTCWFFPKHWRGYTPRFLALDGVHVLTGVPVVFAGDRDHPPALEDDPNAVEHYRKLIAVRKKRPEFARGELLLREIGCDDPWVFTALRRDGDHVGLLVSSLAAVESTPRLSLDYPGRMLEGVELVDPLTGEKVAIRDGVVRLKPFQTLVGRLGK